MLWDAQNKLIKMGLTSVCDFDQGTCFSALQQLHRQGNLKLRVTKSIAHENLDHAIALGLQSGFGDDRLHIGSVKLFADGALGPHTAAMLEAYDDDPNNLGSLFMDGETMFEIGRKAVDHGLSIAVHAIGDRANHEVLNAIENVRRYEDKQGLPHLRHRIEHVQILHPQDADRLAKRNIVASMQPIHALSDMTTADRCWGKRAALSYAWRTQIENGAVLAFGSDAPVESPNPFWGLYAAVTRSRFDGYPQAGWYPEQRLRMQEALHAYTLGVAYACGVENKVGKLAPNYLADMIILNKDEDPFTTPAEILKTIQPSSVMIGGEWVYHNDHF
jgi:predicted amidohydrolase YtcJ